MCRFADLQKIFSKPIQKLTVLGKLPPRRESLRLYRKVYKFAAMYTWTNQHGELWRDVLRRSAKKQFQLNRNLKDSMHVYKLLVTAEESMYMAKQKMLEKQAQFNKQVQESRND